MALKKQVFHFEPFSKKQKQVLTWWCEGSPYKDKDAIIAAGSVRSGKTLIMSLSFVFWAMDSYNDANFGMSGKTIGSFKRNVWFNLQKMLRARGYLIYKVKEINDAWVIKKGDISNNFYIFGGRDERSQDLVQGFTAAGFFFDEAVLQPETFVNQAIARCSEDGAKLWFNCNPDGPFHWFKKGWIDKIHERNALHIHFLLEDNPSLSAKVIARYKRMFVGIFYDRFILGLWVLAEGVIYSMFTHEMVLNEVPHGVKILTKWIGIDYGQANATVFMLLGLGDDNVIYVLDEYYHEGRTSAVQKSPKKYSKDYFKWKIKCGVEGMPVKQKYTYVDPSAKGMIMQLHEDGESNIRQADNEVLKGIELISSLIDAGMFKVLSKCKNTIKELGSYRWDPKAQERGIDAPIKQNDHCLDAIRYVVNGNRIMIMHMLKSKVEQEDGDLLPKENRV